MEEQLVEFETAKLAKAVGFNEPCSYCFTELNSFKKREVSLLIQPPYGVPSDQDHIFFNNIKQPTLLRPTQSLLQRWLEETHSIFIDVMTDTTVNEIMGFQIYLKSWRFTPIEVDYFLDKYEGIEKGLQQALKLIK